MSSILQQCCLCDSRVYRNLRILSRMAEKRLVVLRDGSPSANSEAMGILRGSAGPPRDLASASRHRFWITRFSSALKWIIIESMMGAGSQDGRVHAMIV